MMLATGRLTGPSLGREGRLLQVTYAQLGNAFCYRFQVEILVVDLDSKVFVKRIDVVTRWPVPLEYLD